MSIYSGLRIAHKINNSRRLIKFHTVFTASPQLKDDQSLVTLKEAPLIDKKYGLLTKKDVEDQKSHAELLKIDKQEVISAITGVPEEHIKGRRVRISLISKNPMQSGTDNTHSWLMEFDNRERWENPLMGWTSTGDPLSNMQIQFSSKEDAMDFCDKNGWEWYLEPEKPKNSKVKSYGFNFSWNRRTRVSTK